MKELIIYFTSDVHGYLYPTDYRDNTPKKLGYFNMIEAFQKDGNTLIIDGGDTIQGSPLATYLQANRRTPHPIAQVLNLGDYDYIVLGNHDFNYGYDYLIQYLQDSNARCLTANVANIKEPGLIHPYAIKTLENGLRIGILGITTDFINYWEQPRHLVNFRIDQTMETIQQYHDLIKAQCDIFIGVYHGGFECDRSTGQMLSDSSENISCRICQHFDFDILLTGHQHTAVADEILFGTHIVQTPPNGSQYALLRVQYSDRLMSVSSQLHTAPIYTQLAVPHEITQLEEEVQTWLDQPVGWLNMELLPSDHLTMAYNGHPLANFFNHVQLTVSGADISCTSFANSIKGFNKRVTIRDIVSTYVYPNTLVVLEVTGEILKQALERCASYFDLDHTGQVQIAKTFLRPKLEHYNYDYFSGIDYVFDLRQPVGSRVSSIVFKGAEVQPEQKFKLAMNNYRASGVGGYEFYRSAPLIKDFQTDMSELIINYFLENPNVTVDHSAHYTVVS